MKKGTIIALSLTGLLLAGVGIGLYWHNKKKKKGDSKSPEIKTPEPNPTFDNDPAIKNLKEGIKKSEYTMEIMCPQGNGVVVSCTTGGKYSSGLVQGVWIQMKRSVNKIQKKLESDTSNADVRKYGETLLSGLKSTIDRKFDPKYYNKNQSWYKEYLSKGGSAI